MVKSSAIFTALSILLPLMSLGAPADKGSEKQSDYEVVESEIVHRSLGVVKEDPVPIVDYENFNIKEDTVDDWVIKFKSKSMPYTIREAIEAHLLPAREPQQTIQDLLMTARDKIEDILPLKTTMVVLKSPENQAIPMLLSDVPNEVPQERARIKRPNTFIEEKYAQVYDLRRYFVDVFNDEDPTERVTVSLATALYEEITPFATVADILLNQITASETIMFYLRKNGLMAVRNGQLITSITNNSVSITNEYSVNGIGTWINTLNGGIAVRPQLLAQIGGTLNNLTATFTLFSTHVPGYTNVGGSFYIDPMTALVAGNISTSVGTLLPWYGYANSWNGFGLNGKWNITNVDVLQAISAGAYLTAGNNYLGFGAAATFTTNVATVWAVVQYTRNKSRVVAVSRPPIKFRKDHKYRVSVSDSHGHTAQLNFGATEPVSGFGAVIFGADSKSRATSYQTNLSKEAALRYQEDGSHNGLSHIGHEFMVKDLPDVRNPLSWQEGDEFSTTKTGAYTGALVVGFTQAVYLPLQLQAGATMEVRGTYELHIKRLKESKVEVTVSPTRLEEFGILARLMNFAAVASTHGVAMVLKQKFIFDFAGGDTIDEFSVQTAYQNLVEHGVLPDTLHTQLNIVQQNTNPGHIIEHFALENRMLKTRGIERHTVEITILEHSRLAALAGISLAGVKFFEVEHIRASGTRIIASTNAAVESKISELKKTNTKFYTGQLTTKTFATENILWENPEPGKHESDFNNLILSAEISDSKIIHKDINHMRDELNKIFNLDFAKFTFPAHHESRTVTLERKLSKGDLANLRDNPQLELMILRTSLNPSAITQFMASIKNEGPDKISEKIRLFIADHGLRGFGAIHLLLGGKVEDIKVRTTSSIYNSPLKRSEQFIIKWSKEYEEDDGEIKARLAATLSTTTTQEFFDVGNKILADLKTANEALDDDKFMICAGDKKPWPPGIREDKSALRTRLQEAYASMHKLLLLGHLAENERITIYKKIYKQKRNMMQRAMLLENKFSTPMQVGESRSSLRKRYNESNRIIKEAEKTREEWKTSSIFSDSDRCEMLGHLDACEAQAKRVMTFDNIRCEEDYDKLVKTLNRKHKFPLPNFYKHREQELAFQQIIVASKNAFLESQKGCSVVDQKLVTQEVSVPYVPVAPPMTQGVEQFAYADSEARQNVGSPASSPFPMQQSLERIELSEQQSPSEGQSLAEQQSPSAQWAADAYAQQNLAAQYYPDNQQPWPAQHYAQSYTGQYYYPEDQQPWDYSAEQHHSV